MNCERVRDLLSAYLDDQLTMFERQSVTTHLQMCANCTGVLADYRRFDALLTQLPQLSPPPSLRTHVFSAHRNTLLHPEDACSPILTFPSLTKANLVKVESVKQKRSTPSFPNRSRLIILILITALGLFLIRNLWQKRP